LSSRYTNTLKITIKGKKEACACWSSCLMMLESPHGAWEGDLCCLPAPSAEHDQSRCSANSSTHGTYHIRPRRPVPPASNLYSIRCRLRVACRLAGDQL
jgi:hypothetical protein